MYELMLLVTLFFAGCTATFPYQYSNSDLDGSYSFGFSTGVEGGKHIRQESRTADGVVSGSFSYNDPAGNMRSVQYRAGESGYVASGHVGSVGSPKAQLPIYDVGLPQVSETEASTEPSGEDTEDVPDRPQTADSPSEDEGQIGEKDLGFFVLGLGGKRRLEKPSDTGKLDSLPEPSRPTLPIIYYSVIGLPYGYYSRRPVLVPYPYPHLSYIPYLHAIRRPISKGFSSQANFQTY